VVAHFHYVLVAGSLFAFFGGAYYWLPKWTGTMYNESSAVALLVLDDLLQHHVLPDALPRRAGMPRRIPDYAQQFADWNMVATVGAFGFGLSQLIFVVALIKCIRGDGGKARQAVEGADTLEWTCLRRRRTTRSKRRRSSSKSTWLPNFARTAVDAHCVRQPAHRAGRGLIAVLFFVGVIAAQFVGIGVGMSVVAAAVLLFLRWPSAELRK
jgi:heme/copper-type cytochrome/quinol oxidase subunit 1